MTMSTAKIASSEDPGHVYLDAPDDMPGSCGLKRLKFDRAGRPAGRPCPLQTSADAEHGPLPRRPVPRPLKLHPVPHTPSLNNDTSCNGWLYPDEAGCHAHWPLEPPLRNHEPSPAPPTRIPPAGLIATGQQPAPSASLIVCTRKLSRENAEACEMLLLAKITALRNPTFRRRNSGKLIPYSHLAASFTAAI